MYIFEGYTSALLIQTAEAGECKALVVHVTRDAAHAVKSVFVKQSYMLLCLCLYFHKDCEGLRVRERKKENRNERNEQRNEVRKHARKKET